MFYFVVVVSGILSVLFVSVVSIVWSSCMVVLKFVLSWLKWWLRYSEWLSLSWIVWMFVVGVVWCLRMWLLV